MDFIIDKESSRVIIGDERQKMTTITINEFEKINKTFIEGTIDKYECELVLLDVDVKDEHDNVINTETKAFARRIGYSNWLMEFNTSEYSKIV